MRLKKSFIIFIISLILLNITIVFATAKNNNNIASFFRIHVVANSDSIDDQLLKYQVSKEVEEYISELTLNCVSKEECKKIIEHNVQNILALANDILVQQGYNYDLKAYIGNLEYDEKQKDDIYMSSGIYDSLKIIIGNGNGNNWWSLIYPSSIDNFSEEDSTKCNIQYRFGIIDWFKELFTIKNR